MRFIDKVTLGKRMTDQNGFVSVPAVITKVGIQQYTVDELRNDPILSQHLDGRRGLVNVFRSPETVFHPLTIDSFKNLPVTVSHPRSGVSTDTAKFVSAGHIGSDVSEIDDKKIGATIHLFDKGAIDVSKGSETSAGYDCPVVYDKGTYEGVEYEFRFDGPMIGNHLALVPAGRCGGDVAVLDNKTEIEEMDEAQVKKLVADQIAEGIAKALPAAVENAMKKLDVTKQVTDAVAAANAQAKKDADEQRKKDEAEQKKKEDALKQTNDRISLHVDLKAILDEKEYDTSKSDHDLMVLAVGDLVEDAASKSDEYLRDKVTEIAKDRAGASNLQDTAPAGTGEISLRAF